MTRTGSGILGARGRSRPPCAPLISSHGGTMETQYAKLIEALNRVNSFLAENGDVMGGVITSTAHQNFSAIRGRMVDHMRAQSTHSRSARHSAHTKRRLRDRLI